MCVVSLKDRHHQIKWVDQQTFLKFLQQEVVTYDDIFQTRDTYWTNIVYKIIKIFFKYNSYKNGFMSNILKFSACFFITFARNK